jgi:MoaA/NifB/PqqE/SkfB family radical SAM enzyme
MSTATITPTNRRIRGPSATTDRPAPRPAPQDSWLKLTRAVLDHGGPGYVQFAITNLCNARCDFCNFAVHRLPSDQRHSVTLDEARRALDVLSRNHIGYVLFVGGEPLVHPDLDEMIRYASHLRIRPILCTNGSLLNERRIEHLASAGLASVILSIDAATVSQHENHRGLDGVCERIRQANAVFGRLNLPTTASVTVSRLIEDYDALPPFLQQLGFRCCTFSYPLTGLASSYLSFSDSGLVRYNTHELLQVFDRIKAMKRRSALPVVNPTASLEDMQRHLRGEPERFGCLAGYKYFYLDWHLDLYRCHNWDTPLCAIDDFDGSQLVRDGCTRCMIDCYRDPSVLQFIATSMTDAWHQFRRGRVLQAARHLLDRRNLTSLRAIWETRQFIREV